jgi:ElaB/YqjD/DUF883 family membrane-anchored ribosome-binding protein
VGGAIEGITHSGPDFPAHTRNHSLSTLMKNNQTTTHLPKELLAELQSLVAEAQTMMSDSGSDPAAETIESLRARFGAAQQRMGEMYAVARKRVVAGAKCTDTAIRENPYQSLAVAIGVGLLVGVLLGRRSK